MTDAHTRHNRGLLVVVLLGVVFFTLLTLIVLRPSGKAHKGDDASRSETLMVLPLRIRIRTEPNARAPVVATATSGERVMLLEDQGVWVRVQTGDNLSGWAERVNLERATERERRLSRFQAIRRLPSLAGVTSTRAPLYAGPGIFYPLVGELPGGTSVRVFTRDHDFYAIDYRDQVAYADVENVDVSASGSPQLNVQTTSAAPVQRETTASMEPPPPTETTMTPAIPEPPVFSDEGLVDRGGVYSAVPAGGTQPEEIDRVVPRYPSAARRNGVSGPVVIRGIVRKDGRIDDVEILKDLPNGLGDAAREAVQKWRFRPATFRGDPIDVYYTVTVNFRLQ